MTVDAEAPTLEWWPDHGGELLWLRSGRGGSRIAMEDVGLSDAFRREAESWLETYDDAKLPADGPGDPEWIAEGVRLLADARAQLAGRFAIVVTEPYWGESADDR